ncbi:alkaline phosphatase family protein [Haladaptatus sp. CMSO5]|uniref:alkaline phosphatase family protein n=1 Tax=Haladaptatus sp. CMSO5 TaxID=3120514 RepID=UPI002FCE429A
MSHQAQSKAFVLGLDGVPWYLIEQWVEAGELEHFATLMEDGAAGSLDSTTPATTPLAWPSIATGVRPDKHGLYGFRRLSESYTHHVYTGNDLQRPALWDMVSPAVVGNVPMTYPAREIDGVMVTGMMTPEIGPGFTHPESLTDDIRSRIPDYRIGLNWSQYFDAKDQFLADLNDLVRTRRQLMELLMEQDDWRLFFFVYTAPDRLQHLIWDDDVQLTHYKLLDEILGQVMDYATERDATLYVVSDHGFGPVHTKVALNSLLTEEGLLKPRTERGVRGALSRLGVTKEGVMGALSKVGIDEEMVVEHLPQSLTTQVAKQIPGDHPLFDVDYAETAAFVYSLGEVYVNDSRRFTAGIVDPVEVPAVKRQVKALFEGVTDPETGEQMLMVFDGDDLFPTDPNSPDLVVEPRPGFDISTALADDIISPTRMAANHLPEGIFFAWGPNIEAGVSTHEATVYDVAPTILHGLGEAVPDDTDGRVLSEIFTTDSAAGRTAVKRGSYTKGAAAATASDDFSDVENRLRGLGYIE